LRPILDGTPDADTPGMKRWILAIVVGLGLLAPAARADKRVDWSEYLEPPGSRPMPVRSSPAVAQPSAKASKAKPAKRVAKVKAKAKAKGKAKVTARKKRR